MQCADGHNMNITGSGNNQIFGGESWSSSSRSCSFRMVRTRTITDNERDCEQEIIAGTEDLPDRPRCRS